MADNKNIFRVEKTKDFTVMSNHHLKNIQLTLKAKGLLSLMLSLPENWDYSLSGLVKICAEGKEAINKALKELEQQGYLTRRQIRAEKGRFSRTEFIIREIPNLPCDSPCAENPSTVELQSPVVTPAQVDSPYTENPSTVNRNTENPDTVKPSADKPCPENPPQSSTYLIKELKELNTNQSIYPSEDIEVYEEDVIEDILRENIEYDVLVQDPDYFGSNSDKALLDSIIEIMKQPFVSSKSTHRIGKDEISAEAVRSRLLKLECEHIKYVYDAVFGNERSTKIKNMQAYLLTALYNAPITYHAYQADLCKSVG